MVRQGLKLTKSLREIDALLFFFVSFIDDTIGIVKWHRGIQTAYTVKCLLDSLEMAFSVPQGTVFSSGVTCSLHTRENLSLLIRINNDLYIWSYLE